MNKATIILLAAATLPVLSQAQTVNICDRTPEVRDLLTDDCAAVDSEWLAGIQRFNLESRGLTTLQVGDFNGLTSLQQLRLGHNQLTTLPEGVFDGLTSLQGLDLGHNRLTTLPEGVFDGLTSLELLYLNYNQLTTLPAGVFQGLTILVWLDLGYNQLTTLPAGVFDGLTSLQRLYLGYNRLTTLPEGVFDGLTRLQRLYLNDNQLITLPAGIFGTLLNLEILHLGDNHLTGLRPDSPLFHGLHSLEHLGMDGQTEAPEGLEGPAQRIAAAVPLMISASDSMRQGFVRIINQTDQSGSVRILAFDDAGNAASPIEIQLGASQSLHFNSNDLEGGNPARASTRELEARCVAIGDWTLKPP